MDPRISIYSRPASNKPRPVTMPHEVPAGRRFAAVASALPVVYARLERLLSSRAEEVQVGFPGTLACMHLFFGKPLALGVVRLLG